MKCISGIKQHINSIYISVDVGRQLLSTSFMIEFMSEEVKKYDPKYLEWNGILDIVYYLML